MTHPQKQPDAGMQQIALPVRQFAKKCGVSPMTIYRAIEAGRLRTIRLGKKTQLVLLDSVPKPNATLRLNEQEAT